MRRAVRCLPLCIAAVLCLLWQRATAASDCATSDQFRTSFIVEARMGDAVVTNASQTQNIDQLFDMQADCGAYAEFSLHWQFDAPVPISGLAVELHSLNFTSLRYLVVTADGIAQNIVVDELLVGGVDFLLQKCLPAPVTASDVEVRLLFEKNAQMFVSEAMLHDCGGCNSYSLALVYESTSYNTSDGSIHPAVSADAPARLQCFAIDDAEALPSGAETLDFSDLWAPYAALGAWHVDHVIAQGVTTLFPIASFVHADQLAVVDIAALQTSTEFSLVCQANWFDTSASSLFTFEIATYDAVPPLLLIDVAGADGAATVSLQASEPASVWCGAFGDVAPTLDLMDQDAMVEKLLEDGREIALDQSLGFTGPISCLDGCPFAPLSALSSVTVVCYAEDDGVVKNPGTNHGWMLDGAPADEAQFDRKNNATSASNTVAVALHSLSDLVLVTSPTGQLATSEDGSSVPLQIQLKFKPQAEVVLKVATSDPSEGTISTAAALPGHPAQLLHFNAWNWLDAQTVYVRGQVDGEADGDVPFDISVSVFNSTDPIHSDLALDAVVVPFVNEDSELQVTVAVSFDRNFTSEDGGAIQGTVTLNPKPEFGVVLGITVSDQSAARVLESVVAFHPNDVSSTQSFTVVGVDDGEFGEDKTYSLMVYLLASDDLLYQQAYGETHQELTLTNVESTVNRIALDFQVVNNTGVQATKQGWSSTNGNHTCYLSESQEDAGACIVRVSICKGFLDGCEELMPYSALFASGVDMVYIFMDTSHPTEARFTTVSGEPEPGVEILDGGQAISITFTDANFPSSAFSNGYFQDIALIGLDDSVIDGDSTATVTLYGYIQYNTVNYVPEDALEGGFLENTNATTRYYHQHISVTTADDDEPRVLLTARDCQDGAELSEAGRTCEVEVRLNSIPTAPVTVTLALVDYKQYTENEVYELSDEVCFDHCDGAHKERQVNVTFAVDAWNQPIIVTVAGDDDAVYEGLDPAVTYVYLVVTAVSTEDDQYRGAVAVPLLLVNEDDDVGGFELFQEGGPIVFGTAHPTDENGRLRAIEIQLSQEFITAFHLASLDDEFFVTLPFVVEAQSGLSADIELLQSNVTFDSNNYLQTQFVYYHGLDDNVRQPESHTDAAYHYIKAGPLVSNIPGSESAAASRLLAVLNIDNDGLETSTDHCTTTEQGGECAVVVKYSIWPTDSSTSQAGVALTVSDATEATVHCDSGSASGGAAFVNESFVTFTGVGQISCVLRGVDDFVDDGDIATSLHLHPIAFYGYELVTVRNTFTVQPDDSLTYDSSAEQTDYSGRTPAAPVAVSLTNKDDDTAGIVVVQDDFTAVSYKTGPRDASDAQDASVFIVQLPRNQTTESGGTVRFGIKLASAPTTGVTVIITTQPVNSNGGNLRVEGYPINGTYLITKTDPTADWLQGTEHTVLNPTSGYTALLFGPSNFTQAQPVEIVGLDDLYDDYNTSYTITLSIISEDPLYDNYAPTISLPLENVDDDNFDVEATTSGTVTSEPFYGIYASITVRLLSKPTDTVLFSITSNKPTEAGPDLAILSFSSANFQAEQTVMIKSIDDKYQDGDIPYNITVATLFSEDKNYGSTLPNPEGRAGKLSFVFEFVSLDDPDDVAGTACDYGQYGVWYNGGAGCTPCPYGSYADVAGNKLACRQCPPGTFGSKVGAYGMFVSTDWEGSTADPGCLPCPIGTYNPNWGATECISDGCGEDHCFSLGQTAPSQYTQLDLVGAVRHHWDPMEVHEFSAELELFGEEYEQNEDGYSTFVLACGSVAVCCIWLGIWALRKWGDRKHWLPVKGVLVKMDAFQEEHYTKRGEEQEDDGTGRVLGGVCTFGALALCTLIIVVQMYFFFWYNESTTQALVPVDDEFADSIVVDYNVQVRFVDFTGCQNSTSDIDGNGELDELQVNWMIAGYDTRTTGDMYTEYACVNSDLVVSFAVESGNLTSVAMFSVTASMRCAPCTPIEPEGGNPAGTDDVLSCPRCAVAAASAIEWSVSSDGVFPGDHNRISGMISPPASNTSTLPKFRGSDTSEVTIRLIPTSYRDSVHLVEMDGFRLQYDSEHLGSFGMVETVEYVTRSEELVDYHSITREFLVDSSLIDESVPNSVSAVIELTPSTSQLNIAIEQEKSWIDAVGVIGGMVSMIVGVLVFTMTKSEMIRENKEWILEKLTRRAKRQRQAEMDQELEQRKQEYQQNLNQLLTAYAAASSHGHASNDDQPAPLTPTSDDDNGAAAEERKDDGSSFPEKLQIRIPSKRGDPYPEEPGSWSDNEPPQIIEEQFSVDAPSAAALALVDPRTSELGIQLVELGDGADGQTRRADSLDP